MDRELEATVKRSGACQYHSKSPPEAPLHPWAVPERPWSRPHLDFAGPFLGLMFLVDAYTNWLEVQPMETVSLQATIRTLRRIYPTHGLPCRNDSDR